MFQELIDDYRRQAAQYIADALDIEAGRTGSEISVQISVAAARKRGLAAMLLGLADEYEQLER